MGIKDILASFGSKSKEKREMINQMAEQIRMERIAEERQKSSNLRELEKYEKEDYEKKIKSLLENKRKEREHENNFNYNPINAKNVTGKTQWSVLKEKNLFANQKCIFNNKKNIIKMKKAY